MPLTRSVCAQHTAFLYDRGGHERIMQLGPLVRCQWQRIRDDVSTASVDLASPECWADVAQIEPGRHELVIFRDRERVWEGPVTLVQWGRGDVRIEAQDVMHYVRRLISKQGRSSAYPNVETVVNRARNLIEQEIVRMEVLDPPVNVWDHLRTGHHPDDARTTKITEPMKTTVFDDVDDLAARSGLDYTVVGRSIVLHDTHVPLGITATMTEADIAGDVIVTAYGNELATYAAVSGAELMWGEFGGTDPYYGLWEILDDAYDEEGSSAAPTQTELDSQAKRNLSGRNPTPVTARIPDGSSLTPSSQILVEHLVPGVRVPLVATFAARRFSQNQKLDRVDVTEDESGETIAMTLSPESQNAIEDVHEVVWRVGRTPSGGWPA